MATGVVVGLGFAAVVVMGASVLGTVDRRERYAFVAGVALVLAGLSLVAGATGGLLALLGFALIVASTVPLLLEAPEA